MTENAAESTQTRLQAELDRWREVAGGASSYIIQAVEYLDDLAGVTLPEYLRFGLLNYGHEIERGLDGEWEVQRG